jgi:hypothetical protein
MKKLLFASSLFLFVSSCATIVQDIDDGLRQHYAPRPVYNYPPNYLTP